jgi:hypothetical protein
MSAEEDWGDPLEIVDCEASVQSVVEEEPDYDELRRYIMESEESRLAKLCTKLQRNDASVTNVNLEDWNFRENGYGYGQSLGEVLLNNTHVTSVSLGLHNFLSGDADQTDAEVEPMRHFMRSSATLTCVKFTGYRRMNQDAYSRALVGMLCALSDNPNGCLVELNLHPLITQTVAETLCRFLQQTTSLTVLNLDLSLLHYDAAHADLLPGALGSNTTIQRLVVVYAGVCRIVPACLNQLRLNPHCRLRHLHLHIFRTADYVEDMSLFSELSTLLCASRTLRQLVLEWFNFSKDAMECLVCGLLASRSIADLSFQHGSFDQAACKEFIRFMQTPKPLAYSLRSLDLDSWFSSTSVSLLFTVPSTMKALPGPTIGSSLQSLRLSGVDDAFFPTLGNNAANILIKSLRIGGLRDEGIHLAYIPRLIHLSGLHVGSVNLDNGDWVFYSNQLLASLKDNGSLRSVSIENIVCPVETEGDSPFWFPFPCGKEFISRSRQICKRNRAILDLCAQPSRLFADDATDKTAALSILPTLCLVSQQAKRMAPTTLLSLLIAMDDDIGPFCSSSGPTHKRPSRPNA